MISKIKNKISKIFRQILDLRSYAFYRIAVLRHSHNLPLLGVRDRMILDKLKKEGIYVTSLQELNLASTSKLLKAGRELLPTMSKVDDGKADNRKPEIYTVSDLPDFFNWGKEERLLNIIENYLGVPVAYHGVHLRKDFPCEKQFGTTLWHWDSEDHNILKIIIYLSDVGEEHGAFEYIPLSITSVFKLSYYRILYKLWRAHRRSLGFGNEVLEQIIPRSDWKSCLGSAGTVIFVNTRALFHHGSLRTKERSTQFFVYTTNPPNRPDLCTQYWDNTYPRKNLSDESESIQETKMFILLLKFCLALLI